MKQNSRWLLQHLENLPHLALPLQVEVKFNNEDSTLIKNLPQYGIIHEIYSLEIIGYPEMIIHNTRWQWRLGGHGS